jgi:hypothetical protein
MAPAKGIFFSLLLLGAAQSALGIGGMGFNLGFDFSLDMEDAYKEPAIFENCTLDVGTQFSQAVDDTIYFTGEKTSIFIERTGWKRKNFGLGGKLFIDIVPVVDVVEMSFGFSTWEYEGLIIFPRGCYLDTLLGPGLADQIRFRPDTTRLVLRDFKDIEYMGIRRTPYAKLHFNLTVRKTMVPFPRVAESLLFYAGAGPSLHFATPLLSADVIEKAIGDSLAKTRTAELLAAEIFNNPDMMELVLEHILHQLLTPRFGCHIVAGCSVQAPEIPLGVYVDGKLMVPVTRMDSNVDLRAVGFLLAAGIAVTF